MKLTVLAVVATTCLAATPLAAQEEKIFQPPPSQVALEDIDELGGMSEAVVLARFVSANASVDDVRLDDGMVAQSLVTRMTFTVTEQVKVDQRIPANGQMVVCDIGGVYEFPSRKVLEMSELALKLEPGHEYFLFLVWSEERNAFAVLGGEQGAFDVSGGMVKPLQANSALHRRTPGMQRDAVLQALRASARSTKRNVHFPQ